jgi:HAD superfamily hydrolase (TIGR01509 family)
MKTIALDIRDKVLFFDFDGTLVETESLAQEVIKNYFLNKNPGYEAPSEFIIGRTWQAAVFAIETHAKEHGIKVASADELLKAFKDGYQARLVQGVNLIPGIIETLEKIRTQAKFMGIVTGSDHEEVKTILKYQQLGGYFSRIWAYGDYELSKPDPSPYLTALRDLNVKACDAIVFEDSKAGMESAHRAGIVFVQIAHEAHAKDLDPRALCTVQNWNELNLRS